jgi:hypothetical protein
MYTLVEGELLLDDMLEDLGVALNGTMVVSFLL